MADFCGLLGLPVDFSAEWEFPAKIYQTCLPQVFRNINTVTRFEDELVGIVDGVRPNVTDAWEVVHIESASPAYDHEEDILRGLGFQAAITAPEIDRMMHVGGDTSTNGYWDEYGIEAMFHYVDHTIRRNPRPRMYISWLTVATHTPFNTYPAWHEQHYQPFVDDKRWDSTDRWLNAVRWSDDKVKEIIEGFRDRGLENETLFVMFSPLSNCQLIEAMETMDSRLCAVTKQRLKTPTTKLIKPASCFTTPTSKTLKNGKWKGTFTPCLFRRRSSIL